MELLQLLKGYLQLALFYLLLWFVGVCCGVFLFHKYPEIRKRWEQFSVQDSALVQALTDSIRHPTEVIGDRWYAKASDLRFFKERIKDTASHHDADWWEPMTTRKEEPGEMMYTAWRRDSGMGTTEYKTVTIHADATAEELSDFYLDDAFRMTWDNMIKDTEVLEQGDLSQREQVVRWIRGFPFNFITDREYVMARRVFREEGIIYGITKSIDKKRVQGVREELTTVVPVQNFYSMWSLKTVQCPWDSSQTACVTTLLHHEDLQVPEHLARLTVKLSMFKFVKRMAKLGVRPFIDQRRQHCDPHAVDLQAFSAQPKPGARPAVVAYAVEPAADEGGGAINGDDIGAHQADDMAKERKRLVGKGDMSPRSVDSDYIMVTRRQKKHSGSALARPLRQLAVAILGLTFANVARTEHHRRRRSKNAVADSVYIGSSSEEQ